MSAPTKKTQTSGSSSGASNTTSSTTTSTNPTVLKSIAEVEKDKAAVAAKKAAAKEDAAKAARVKQTEKDLKAAQTSFQTAQLKLKNFMISEYNKYPVAFVSLLGGAGGYYTQPNGALTEQQYPPAWPAFTANIENKNWADAGFKDNTYNRISPTDKDSSRRVIATLNTPIDYTYKGLIAYLLGHYGKTFETQLAAITDTGYSGASGKTYEELFKKTTKNYTTLQAQSDALKKEVDRLTAQLVADKAGLQVNVLITPTTTSVPDLLKKPKVGGTAGDTAAPTTLTALTEVDSSFRWNLPPHQWSLPVDPTLIDKDYMLTDRVNMRDRLGTLWVALPSVDVMTQDGSSLKPNLNPNRYGFQFMWNPTTFSAQAGVNFSTTPSPTDFFNSSGFAYTANASITIQIVLDRTNDFACFKAQTPTPSTASFSLDRDRGGAMVTAAQTNSSVDVEKFYKGWQKNPSDPISISNRVTKLLKNGTLADVDYLYMAINGDLLKNKLSGNHDVGWLRPTLMMLELGPIKTYCLVSSVNIEHTSFTPNMVPIRSTVTLQLDLKANVSASTGGNGSGNIPTTNPSTVGQ